MAFSQKSLAFISLSIFIHNVVEVNSFRTQSAGVRGILKCGDTPLAHTKVKLWDRDRDHDCDDGIMPCQRKVTFNIPDSYVNDGSTVAKFFDIGTVNMQIVFTDEERDCINRKK